MGGAHLGANLSELVRGVPVLVTFDKSGAGASNPDCLGNACLTGFSSSYVTAVLWLLCFAPVACVLRMSLVDPGEHNDNALKLRRLRQPCGVGDMKKEMAFCLILLVTPVRCILQTRSPNTVKCQTFAGGSTGMVND